MNKIFKIVVISFLVLYSSDVLAQGNAYLRAKACFDKGEYENSANFLNDYLVAFPYNQEARILRARTSLNLKKYELAIKDLNGLKSSKKNEILMLEARANAGLGNNKLCFEKLEQYKNTFDKIDENTINSYAEFNSIKSLLEWETLWKNWKYSDKEQLLINIRYAIKSERFGEAADRLDLFLAKYKTNAEAYYLRGLIFAQNKDYKNALDLYRNAVNLDKTNSDYQIAEANVLHFSGLDKKALDAFNTILLKDSLSVDAYLGRAQVNLSIGNYEKSLQDIAFYLEYYPSDINAQYIEAQIDSKSGDYLGAIGIFGKLIKTDPAKPEYFIGRADAYSGTKTYEYAIKDYSMALDLNPKNIEVYKKRAKVYKEMGNTKNACIDWGHAAKLGDVESLNNFKRYSN